MRAPFSGRCRIGTPLKSSARARGRWQISLYRHLITDSIWQEARAEMGYQPVPSTPLMLTLGGQPYIDVRASFNSFLPAGLPTETRERLVDAWLDRLETNPETARQGGV